MRHKLFDFSGFKALDDGKGEFEAVVAVFGNVDLGGDRIIRGAFTNSLATWKAKGRPIPVIFSHDWGNLDAHIGAVVEAKETAEGLYVRAQLDMDDPSAAKVWRLLKRGTISEFSFAYDIVRERVANGANELLELDVIEVGPTLKGMNPATRLIGAKAGGSGQAALPVSHSKQAVAGSYEERRETVGAAVRSRYGGDERYFAYVVATYDDRVIVAIHSEAGVSYREIDYTLKNGGCELGDERDVQLQTMVVAKSQRDMPLGRHPGVVGARASIELMGLGFNSPAKGSTSPAALRAQIAALGKGSTTADNAMRELLAAGFDA